MKVQSEKKQIVMTVSNSYKEWANQLRSAHKAPGATTDELQLSERELSDALHALFQPQPNADDGDSVPSPHLTALEACIASVLANRGTGKSSKSTLTAQVDTLKAQADAQAAKIAELMAALEAAQAQAAPVPAPASRKK